MLVLSAVGGCVSQPSVDTGTSNAARSAEASPGSLAPPDTPSPGHAATGMPTLGPSRAPGGEPRHVRKIGSADQGNEVTLRHGDLLTVALGARPGGWDVVQYPSKILQLQPGKRPSDSFDFLAIAVGEGSLTIEPVGPIEAPATPFMVRVRVMRDLVQPPQP